MIVGEPGLGKSRLIEEFHSRLSGAPHTWVEWSCSQLPQNTPLHPNRPAAALVPSTSHGAARIMIELRNKDTLTGKLCCFQIVLCAQLGGDFLKPKLDI